MKSSAIIGVIVLLLLVGAAVFYMRDMSGPKIVLSPGPGLISGRLDLSVSLRDFSGLRNVTVTAIQGKHIIPLLSKEYPAGTKTVRETFRLAQQPGVKDGPVRLRVTARDQSIFHFGAGNQSVQSVDYSYLNKPPAVTALSIAHNITRGGVGCVVYTINREVVKQGVVFGDRFFPGYKQFGDVYACLFPFPYNMPADSYIPKIIAVDRAGNERLTGIYFHLLPKSFPTDRLEVPDSFLNKVQGEFQDRFPEAKTPLELYLKINRDLRQHDLKILADCGRNTSPVPLWEGEFVRLPNGAPKGLFAQFRTYYYHGKMVDQQTHLGIDLSSLAHSPVPAANRGRIVYADDLGIYGQCVIIDHGLGLQTLYGHLSRIDVKVGDNVQKGQIVGATGDTGLAGGDHLHYGVVVSGEQVNPIEWWDPSWINNNVTSKLETAKEMTRR